MSDAIEMSKPLDWTYFDILNYTVPTSLGEVKFFQTGGDNRATNIQTQNAFPQNILLKELQICIHPEVALTTQALMNDFLRICKFSKLSFFRDQARVVIKPTFTFLETGLVVGTIAATTLAGMDLHFKPVPINGNQVWIPTNSLDCSLQFQNVSAPMAVTIGVAASGLIGAIENLTGL